MNKPEPGTTSNDNNDSAEEGPVRWAGVDWSWSEHAVCVIDDAGAAVERFTVTHTAPGLSKLVTALHRHRVTGVAIERGDGPVVQALLEAGLAVFVIVSRQVTALRTRYGTTGNKDDRFDAYLLADVLRTDRQRLTPLTVDTPATVGLRMLIRARQDLVKARVAAHNQLRAHLQLAHPGVVGLFHQLDGKISLAFLTRFPTPRHARWLSEKRLATWLSAARYTRPNTRTPAQLFDHLRHAPAGLPDGPAADAAQIITLELIALLRSLRERITTLETSIEQALARARRPGGLHQPAPLRQRPGRDHARRDRRRPRPLPHRRSARRRSRDRAVDPRVRAIPLRRVPPRLQLPPAPGRRRLRRRQPPWATPGPKTSTPEPEPAGTTTPTPSGSSPAPGCASSGAAGRTALPTTRPGTWPRS